MGFEFAFESKHLMLCFNIDHTQKNNNLETFSLLLEKKKEADLTSYQSKEFFLFFLSQKWSPSSSLL